MELVRDEMLQEETALIIEGAVQRASKQSVPNAEVEDEDLRVRHQARAVGS